MCSTPYTAFHHPRDAVRLRLDDAQSCVPLHTVPKWHILPSDTRVPVSKYFYDDHTEQPFLQKDSRPE